jgi:Na+/melibiose symporter-like transporter
MALRSFVSFAPVVVLLISFAAVYVYPITRERHAEIRAELQSRQVEA